MKAPKIVHKSQSSGLCCMWGISNPLLKWVCTLHAIITLTLRAQRSHSKYQFSNLDEKNFEILLLTILRDQDRKRFITQRVRNSCFNLFPVWVCLPEGDAVLFGHVLALRQHLGVGNLLPVGDTLLRGKGDGAEDGLGEFLRLEAHGALGVGNNLAKNL